MKNIIALSSLVVSLSALIAAGHTFRKACEMNITTLKLVELDANKITDVNNEQQSQAAEIKYMERVLTIQQMTIRVMVQNEQRFLTNRDGSPTDNTHD